MLCCTRARAERCHCQEQGSTTLMRHPRPCLECGKLSLDNRCEDCNKQFKAKERKRLQSLPKLRDKSAYYDSTFRKQAKAIRESATHCYLCSQSLWDLSGAFLGVEVDHVYPSKGNASPLLPAHPSCNKSKGKRDFDPNLFPNASLPPGR